MLEKTPVSYTFNQPELDYKNYPNPLLAKENGMVHAKASGTREVACLHRKGMMRDDCVRRLLSKRNHYRSSLPTLSNQFMI